MRTILKNLGFKHIVERQYTVVGLTPLLEEEIIKYVRNNYAYNVDISITSIEMLAICILKVFIANEFIMTNNVDSKISVSIDFTFRGFAIHTNIVNKLIVGETDILIG